MKINYNGIEYSIYWKFLRYEPYKDFNHKTSKEIFVPQNEYTECYIESLTKGIQIISRATKTPPDQFNKEIGRKLSFTRALQLLFPDRKEARKFFWHCYFEFTNQHDKLDDLTFVARMNNNFSEIL